MLRVKPIKLNTPLYTQRIAPKHLKLPPKLEEVPPHNCTCGNRIVYLASYRWFCKWNLIVNMKTEVELQVKSFIPKGAKTKAKY